MTRWEYRVEQGNPHLSSDQLNQIGADGWELISTAPRGGTCLIYHFKRPAGGTA